MREKKSPLAAEWEAALDDLRLQMTQATFDTWLKSSELVGCEDDTFVVGVANTYARDWLEHRLLPVITRTLARRAGHPVDVEFVVAETIEEELS
jgi:chromosomal replication initiator protein